MDGNRRWAKQRGLPEAKGHWKGAEALIDVVQEASDLGIKILTVFGFSTENWKRSQGEIDPLFAIMAHFLVSQAKRMVKEGVRLRSIGDIGKLPPSLQASLKETEELTKNGNVITLVLALSYGGRDELVRAFQKMLHDAEKKKFQAGSVDEELISSYLDTREFPDLDLFIRTSGEKRVSNFLLWQSAYTELYFTDVLWPDFLPEHLREAVADYKSRNRRKGV